MRSVFINIIAVILLLTARPASAGSSVSAINVTTTVLPVIKYEIIHQEKSLIITDENIQRGYIDVSGAVMLSVMTNSKNGYMLTFFIPKGLFEEVEVFYDAVSSEIRDAGSEIHMSSRGMSYAVKEFSFRFYLSDTFIPGRYDWPVALMIQAV